MVFWCSRWDPLSRLLWLPFLRHSSRHPRRCGLRSGTRSPSPTTSARRRPLPPFRHRLTGKLRYHQPYDTHFGQIYSPRPPSFAHPSSISVGNGSVLPVTLVGDSVLPRPFYLNDVLLAPNLVRNLFSVHRFTVDNYFSMEFDSFELFVKDLATRRVVARCGSTCLLYTLPQPPLPRVLSHMSWLPLLPQPPSIIDFVTPASMSSPSC
jgi:hypothetical protein